MGNKELFKTVLFGGFQKEEVWNYMQEVEAELLPVIYIAGPNYHPAWNNRLGGEHPDAIISSIWGSREVELTFIKK